MTDETTVIRPLFSERLLENMTAPTPDKTKVFAEASRLVTFHNFDLPKAGQYLETIHRYHGPDSEVREKLEAFGREFRNSEVLYNKLVGYVLECYAHYFYSKECAFDQNRKHPDFEEYFQHWFYSQADYVEKSARSYFQQRIKQPTNLKIQTGKTIWHFRRQNPR
ncbi:hypothetical protein [Azonexus sp.]|uniref:hypothetical protein n=1 Tax=Azonexus sp. TaxID=1872668 RepID=UPI0027BB0BE3|nr:hypothetical protein [Azonexus sp.]